KEQLQGFKPGARVDFKAATRDGKRVLLGMRLAEGPAPAQAELKNVDSSHLKPLTELGSAEYQGFPGGLYPKGQNERPAEHERAGLALAKQVQPLGADGKPSPEGKIVLLSIGMSNTKQSSEGFKQVLARAEGVNPHLVFVNGS